ncbi:MAG: DeoR family transcriptional regulator [Anaerolineae bacterium]|nr:DeoR family transcriptional regulator [Anaerolineae bacterium]
MIVDDRINHKKRSTRDIILHTIKQSPQSTVEELAGAADISPVTVRHHLNALQADGIIETASIRRKVGRPYYVYSLSEKGQELFPKRYVRLTSRLLDQMKGRFPEHVITEIFEGIVDTLLCEHRIEYEHLTLEQRLDYLVQMLSDEGFLSTWERTAEGYRLIEYSCPYLSIGNTHAEVCTFDKQLMSGILQLQIQQDSCMLHGSNSCQFSIVNNNAEIEPPIASSEFNYQTPR